MSSSVRIHTFGKAFAALLALGFPVLSPHRLEAAVDYVINISVDGLGSSYLQSLLNAHELPNFQTLQTEGAWTLNARNDYSDTTTVVNHTGMMTGRAMVGPLGHNWVTDTWVAGDPTLHEQKGSYVASVFDMAHDNGLSTALYASKSKFELFKQSYNAINGAPDTTGADNGPQKIDGYVYTKYTDQVNQYVAAMTASPLRYSFVHFRDPDTAGHGTGLPGAIPGWGKTDYDNSIRDVDGYLGSILNLVKTDPRLQGHTAIVLTADHGGVGTGHSTVDEPLDYTIPFYVWGPNVTAGADLYAMNTTNRRSPGLGRRTLEAPLQPIRNADMANLSLTLLGLPAVTGSTINARQDLVVDGVALPQAEIVAKTYFREPAEGSQNFTPGAGQEELGFQTTATPAGTGTLMAAVYSSTSSPTRFRMQSVAADTTFAPINLDMAQAVTATLEIRIKDATYHSGDFFRAVLTDGVHSITLAEVQGAALNALPKAQLLNYTARVPASWTTAMLKISGHVDASAEALDFDNIEFQAVPASSPFRGAWNQATDNRWSTAANWNGVVPDRPGDVATLGPAAWPSPEVNLDGGRTMGSLTLNDPMGYRLSGETGDSLILSNRGAPAELTVEGASGNHEIATPLVLIDPLEVAIHEATTLTIAGGITGAGGLTKSGEGTLRLSGSNHYLGITQVDAGLLEIAGGNALPGDQALVINGGRVVLDTGLNVAVRVHGLSINLPRPTASRSAAVPEPGSMVLLLAAVACSAVWLRTSRGPTVCS